MYKKTNKHTLLSMKKKSVKKKLSYYEVNKIDKFKININTIIESFF